MRSLRIEQFEVDKYRVVGSIDVTTKRTKQVEVDGEIYYKDIHETKSVCATSFDLTPIELDELEYFGFKPTILEYGFLYNNLFKREAERECRHSLSTNDYIAYWQWLDCTKRLPYYVSKVWTGETSYHFVENQKLSPYCTIKLLDYGFKNSLYADVSWRMILTRKDKKSIPNHESIAKLLERHGISFYKLTDKNLTLNSIKLLNKIIYNETNK